ncbi:galactose oxidase early set domain-containing protein [Hymenobacter antarcticus]|uniref:Galactose oxidase-like Early set domain-containing protein n=1 Tax=Hymenobacter antarcticus TaxID=486270 RepID=A0ABP7QPN2_9BACT
MADGRWYPTNTSLLDGRVLVTAGLADECDNSRQNNVPDLWQNGTWFRLTGAARELPLYPMMFAASNGKVFCAGPNVDTGYLDPTGSGSWTMTGTTALGTSLGGTPGPGMQNGRRDAGTAVMYQPDRLLLIGGSGGYGSLNPDGSRQVGVTNTTELIELTTTGATFRPGPPMQYPRYHVNSTLLPDGSVLVTGGTTSAISPTDNFAVLPAERWLPPSTGYPDGRWVAAAAMQKPRLYRSTALLLPDGRVLSAGGGSGGGYSDQPNAELYSPWYLFNGARPELTTAPPIVGYQEQFQVATPSSAAISRVTLVRLSSVTHSFNMNQRFLELSFAPAGATNLTVTAPVNANCPPGQYLLFVLNSQGIPSVGRVITVDVNRCPPVVSFTETELSANSCQVVVRVRASGTNLGTSPRWFVDGVLQTVPAGQLFTDVVLDPSHQMVSYELEVTPPCGGQVSRVRGTIKRLIKTSPPPY